MVREVNMLVDYDNKPTFLRMARVANTSVDY
jgi:hypothetical protein